MKTYSVQSSLKHWQPKNTTAQELRDCWQSIWSIFVLLFSLCISTVFAFSALEQSLRMFWSSSFLFMRLIIAYKCRCCHNKLSVKMLAFPSQHHLTNIHFCQRTNTDFNKMISNTSSKNININSSKPCLILVLFSCSPFNIFICWVWKKLF